MATRIGVDVGGTFTDLVFFDEETGETHVAKGPSTSGQPDVGVLDLVRSAVGDDRLRRSEYFLHGTTVGINALLERKGACVGLLTTEGFRDVLELRRGTRGEAMYDVHFQPSPTLVPRRLRFGVGERILSDGVVERVLNADDIRGALEAFRTEKVDAVAVCFVNAYVNPEHELQAERVLRELGFEGTVTLSHRISREVGEFERTATSVVDAYVRPAVAEYLHRLDSGLRESGFHRESLVTRSGGGSISFEEAEARPFETLMSGPVAGAVGAGSLAQELGLARAITADVGGTSFDTCLLADGWPRVKYEGEVGDLPLQTQWVDVRSIGSGGGSIAHVDESALLRVGPESAGAVPGPACYGRGGVSATTTDAAAALGMLAFGELAGGLRLDVAAAEKAIDELGAPLGLPRDQVASGIITIAGAAMAGAVRSVTIEQGEDPREASLIAYGGAGPMLATTIARELGITSIIIPEHAGNFSASGLLRQDITRATSATHIRLLDEPGLTSAHQTVLDLQDELEQRAAGSTAANERKLEVALEMRYVGQLHTLDVPWTNPSATTEVTVLADVFETQYRKIFGHTYDGRVEIVAIRATLREALPNHGATATREIATTSDASRQAYSIETGEWIDFVVRDRAALTDEPCSGPMIVLEPTTTTYIDVGWTVRQGSSRALIMSSKEA